MAQDVVTIDSPVIPEADDVEMYSLAPAIAKHEQRCPGMRNQTQSRPDG